MGSPVKTTFPVAALGFPAAMQAVLDGKKVTRQQWGDAQQCLLKATVTDTGWPTGKPTGDFLAIRYPSGKIDAVLMSAGELEATDWIVVKEN